MESNGSRQGYVLDGTQFSRLLASFSRATNARFFKASGRVVRQIQLSDLLENQRHRVLWEATGNKGLDVPFLGLPFLIWASGTYACHRGPNTHRRVDPVSSGYLPLKHPPMRPLAHLISSFPSGPASAQAGTLWEAWLSCSNPIQDHCPLHST